MPANNQKKIIAAIISMSMLAFGFAEPVAAQVGLSVGSNSLNLTDPGHNLFYGLTSGSTATGSFMKFQKGAGNTVFQVDYNGNITTTGSFSGNVSGLVNGLDLTNINPNIMENRYSSFESFYNGQPVYVAIASGATGAVSSDYSIDGNYSYKLTTNSTDGYCILNSNLTMNVKPSTKYIFSYYAYRASGSVAGAQMYTKENGAAGTYRGCTISPASLGTGKWVRCSTSFTTAADATRLDLIRADVDSNGTATETIYFDGVQIEEVSASATLASPYRSPAFNPWVDSLLGAAFSGNVGIGTTSLSTYKLNVAGNFSASNGNVVGDTGGNITFESFTDKSNVLYKLDPSSSANSLNVAGSITALGTSAHNYFAGRVGIRNSSPGAQLEVEIGNSGTETFLLSNSFNNYGLRTGNGGYAGLFGYQQGNDTGSGDSYGTVLSMNAFYNGTSWSTVNGWIRPSFINLGLGGNIIFATQSSSQGGAAGVYTPTEVMRITNAGNVGIGTTNPGGRLDVNGVFRLGELYYSDLKSITLPVGTETWVNLATIPNNGTVRFQIRTGSQNSEEISEVKIFGTYHINQTGITVERQTYNGHLREVRVTGSDGGSKTIYIRIRTDSFSPTLTWRVIESKGAVAINNIEASPSGGLALLVNGNLSINTNVGMNIAGSVGIGTSTPQAKLAVTGGNIFVYDATINSLTPKAVITKEYLDSSLSSTTASIITQVSTSSFWQGQLNNDIWANNTLNVGIGTTDPGVKLDVVGGAIRTNNQLISTIADGTAPLSVVSATQVNNLTSQYAGSLRVLSPNAAIDYNTMSYGRTYDYGSGNTRSNGPTGMSYGSVYNFGGGDASQLSLQMAADINHNSTASTRRLWFRTGNNLGFQNDWKEIYHSGNLTNTLSAGYAPKWDGAKFINSVIYDNGTNIGIGTSTSLLGKLHVSGTGYFTNTVTVGTPTAGGHAITRDYLDQTLLNKLTAQSIGTLNVNAIGDIFALYGGSTGSWTNRGPSGHNGGAILHIPTHPGGYYSDLWFDTANNRVYSRAVNAGTIGGWSLLPKVSASTANYLTKWSSEDSLTRSIIYDNGSSVGIGTTNPGAKLDVNGTMIINNMALFGSPLSDLDDWQNSPISIRERGFAGAGDGEDRDAPNLNFHWSSRVSNSLWVNSSGKLNYGSYSATGIPASDGTFITGSVGIGTTNPQKRLDLGGGTNGRIYGIDTSASAIFTDSEVVPKKWIVDNFAPAVGGASLWATSSAGIYNVGLGNVGVGTSNPINAKLQVAGDIVTNTGGRISPVATDIGAANITYNATGITDARFQFNGYYGHRFDTEGGTRMVINRAGNVGIGTTNPGTSKLSIEVSNSNTNFDTSVYPLKLRNMAWLGNQVTGIEFWNGAQKVVPTARIISQMNGSGAGGENLHFQTQTSSVANPNPNQPTTKFSILANGSVGIGTTNPQKRLDLGGGTNGRIYGIDTSTSAIFTDSEVVPKKWIVDNFAPAVGGASLWATSSTGTYNIGLGNVGIGTTAADEKLTIGSGNIKLYSLQNTADAYRYIGTEYNSGNGNNKAEIRFAIDGSDTKTRLTFHTANGAATLNEQMRITSGGNVGIGTTSPSTKLHVYDAASGPLITMSGLDTNYRGLAIKNTSNAEQWFLGNNASNNLVFRRSGSSDYLTILASNGNVGIGTTNPSTKLEVGNYLDSFKNTLTIASLYQYEPEINFRLGQSGTNYDWSGAKIVVGDDGNYNGKIEFKTAIAGRAAPTTKMIIKANGNVSIGTTTVFNSRLTILGDAELISPSFVSDGHVVTKKYLSDSLTAFKTYHVSGVTDIHNIPTSTTNSMYTFFSSAVYPSNSPVASSSWVQGIQFPLASNPDYRQVLASNDGNLYYGSQSNKTWSPWRKLWDSGNLTNNLTANYLPKWNGSSLANSLIYDNGTSVAIGTNSPATGRMTINETTGTVHGASRGSLVLDHNNTGGASSISFRSYNNRGSDYGFIQYQDTSVIGAAGESARLIIGTSNDTDDHILLMPSGNVGIGNTNPTAKLVINSSPNTVSITAAGTMYNNDNNLWLKFDSLLTDSLKVQGNVKSTNGHAITKTGYVDRNLLPTYLWTIGSGSVGGFGINGSASENERVWDIGPFGQPAMVWKSVNDAASDGDGGWGYNDAPVDPNKSYRLAVWVKKNNQGFTTNTGNVYLGCGSSGNTLNLNGTANNNPYFFSFNSNIMQADRWYLLVGYIRANSDSSTTNSEFSGVYDGLTGQKIVNGVDYKNSASATSQTHRVYNYYDTNAGSIQYFWGPRFEEIDGNEPSIEAMLGVGKSATRDIPGYFANSIMVATTTVRDQMNIQGTAHINGGLYVSGGGSFSSLNVFGKLTVNTIDPLYKIKGVSYSTFAPSFVGGVKEEISGRLRISEKTGDEYQAVIDFTKQKLGSDLWVWYNVIDFNKDNVEAVITPYGSFANVYYYISGTKIVFKADRPAEISYRLTGKRFDWRKWPTRADDQTERPSFIID